MINFVLLFLLLANPALAGAICRDGWISQSSGSGTCSHHGGVYQWTYSQPRYYRPSPTPPEPAPKPKPLPRKVSLTGLTPDQVQKVSLEKTSAGLTSAAKLADLLRAMNEAELNPYQQKVVAHAREKLNDKYLRELIDTFKGENAVKATHPELTDDEAALVGRVRSLRGEEEAQKLIAMLEWKRTLGSGKNFSGGSSTSTVPTSARRSELETREVGKKSNPLWALGGVLLCLISLKASSG